MPGHPDWAGTGTLSQAAVQAELLGGPVSGGQSAQVVASMIRQGYEIYLNLLVAPGGGAAVPCLVEMTWNESSIAQQTGYQRWRLLAGNGPVGHVINGSGPSNGNQLTLTVTNVSGGAPAVQVFAVVLDVARPYLIHDWRSRDDLGLTIPGYTLAKSDLAAGLLGGFDLANVAANGTTTVLLPLYSGSAEVQLGTTSGTSDAELDLDVAAELHTVSANWHNAVIPTDLTGHGQAMAWLPRAQSVLTLLNKNAAIKQLECYVTVAQGG